MVKVYLYGKLRRHAPDACPSSESVMQFDWRPEENVGTILERVGISPDEIYHVFLNGALLGTRNSMAPWLRYQPASSGTAGRQTTLEALDKPVQDGDRLGVFGCDMALLVV